MKHATVAMARFAQGAYRDMDYACELVWQMSVCPCNGKPRPANLSEWRAAHPSRPPGKPQ